MKIILKKVLSNNTFSYGNTDLFSNFIKSGSLVGEALTPHKKQAKPVPYGVSPRKPPKLHFMTVRNDLCGSLDPLFG